jgi:hypothetical protein
MDFIEGLKEEKASLIKRLDPEIVKRLNAINVLLESYNSASTDIHQKFDQVDDDYPVDSSYLKQIAYIIKKENRFLHNNEIANALKKHSNKDIDFLKKRVSSVLSTAKEEGEGNLVNIRVGSVLKNTFWGSKEWLDVNGYPKEEHMYDKSLVSVRKTKGINI